jgi:hypothetical protein
LAHEHVKGRTLLDAAIHEMKRGHTTVVEVMRIRSLEED